MKAVEIEFLMKDNLTGGLNKAGQVVDGLVDKAQKAADEINAKILEQEKAIDQTVAALNKMEQELQGMKPGTAQEELAAQVMGCRKVLEEERTTLHGLKEEHSAAEIAITSLREGYDSLERSQERASIQNKTLTERIEEQRTEVKRVEGDLKALEKQLGNAVVGSDAFVELKAETEACALALEEERKTLAELEGNFTKVEGTTKRLSRELSLMQDAMVRMRLEGKQNTEEYAALEQKAAELADTLGDVRAQTNVLAHDNSGLQGVISGATGAAGAMTAFTGAMGLLAGQNENLIKIQTKVQSVMAITMGLQQVMNTLNQDSAFRLVTLTKIKHGFATANTRLAVALGISNTAAKALMGTLTLGLSVVIGAAIAAWDKYSDSQKNAAEQAQERIKIEAEGRAQMIKTRFELETQIKTIKNFNGSKEEEKNKVEELNSKYGESFGYYNTLAEWYDILIQKSEDYIQMLFMQAKVQALVNKAVEADEQVNTIKETKESDVEGSMPWYAKVGLYMAQSDSYGQIDAQALIQEHNKKAKEDAVKAAEAERDAYLDEATKLQEEYAKLGKESGIGGFVKPETPKPSSNPKNEADQVLALETKKAEELQKLRWKNEQEAIDQMKEGSEKRIRQIQLDYEKEIAEIKAQEAQWRDAQKGELSGDQSTALVAAYGLAQSGMEQSLREIEEEEVRLGKEKLNALLDEYKNYDQRRRSIDELYAADMAVYNAETERLRSAGEDTSDIEASIAARTDTYRKEIQALESDILRSTDFYDKLFADVSEKGYRTLKDFYAQAKEVLANAQTDGDTITVEVPVKDADGKFVKQAVKLTVDEFQKMKKQVDGIKKELEKNNPFKAFQTSWGDLMKAVKSDGDVTGALKKLNSEGKNLTSTISGWGDSLGAVFGDRFSNSINEMTTFVDGAMDMGTGIAQIFAGDIVGGITNTLSGLGSIISMMSSWKEKMEEMKREWYIAEIETNRAIRERNQELAISRDTIQDIIKNQELLNWLVEKGYSKPSSSSIWEAQSAALAEYQKNLEAEMRTNDELWGRLQGSDAHWEWGNSMNGGSVTHSLRGMTAEQIELYYNQDKLTKEARAYYEAWVESGKAISELVTNIEDCYAAMQEMVMGVSFDGFLSNVKGALKDARGDVSKFADFTEETIAEALLNAFMYQDLAKTLEPLYNELSENMINGTADKEYLENWKLRFQQMMEDANNRLDVIAETTGVDLYSGGTSQSGKAGAFTTITQDQGTKLEGLFTSGQMHWASIDENMEDVAEQMGVVSGILARIEEHAKESKESLKAIMEDVKRIIREGLKVK